ncbi:unnamed protein product [Sphagnum tenellum]
MILALLVVTLGVSFLILRRRKKPYFIASFAGKHVLITGASSGIGLALSKKSLQEGAFVTLVARNSAKLEQVAGSLLKDLQWSTDPEIVEGMKVANLYNRKEAQSAEEVAEISIAGINYAGSFLITTTPYLGSLLSVLGRGVVPAGSLVKNILEAIAYVPLRMITFFSAGAFKTKLVNIHQKHNSSR